MEIPAFEKNHNKMGFDELLKNHEYYSIESSHINIKVGFNIDFLFELFEILKEKMDVVVNTMYDRSIYVRVYRELVGTFKTNLIEQEEIEPDIIDLIETLKENRFKLNTENTEKFEYLYSIDELLDNIKMCLLELRGFRIKFWEMILDEYTRNKENYTYV